eukprot:scaffold17605_cov54-Phaeocystis_antarctica.AAC.1
MASYEMAAACIGWPTMTEGWPRQDFAPTRMYAKRPHMPPSSPMRGSALGCQLERLHCTSVRKYCFE